jgi:NitT/TauT family transport system permease protein
MTVSEIDKPAPRTEPAPRAAGSSRRRPELPARIGPAGRQEAGEPRTSWSERALRVAVPSAMLVLLLAVWQVYVTVAHVPHYILPSPVRIAEALVEDWPMLGAALLSTLRTTFIALGLALVGGVALAVLLVQSRWIELALYPYAVILQVTPIVAIAPLIIIYTSTTEQALLICAWIVAFFPVLSNTVQGLKSTDHNLLNLFELYGASRWQTLIFLKLPNALPYFLAGLRIAGGLALIAAVVAEFAAGTAGAGAGLAFRLIEAQHRLNIPRLFAALFLLSLTGVAIFLVTGRIAWLLLHKWHESAVRREN